MNKLKQIILNKTLFIIFMLMFTLSIIVTLVILQFSAKNDVSIDEIMEETHYRKTVKFPMELHYSNLNDKQIELVNESLNTWKKSTNGKIDIVLVNWNPPEPFSEWKYKNYEKYTIWMLNGNDKEVAILFAKYKITMNGLCVGNFIGIIEDNEMNDQQLTKIITHEVGHLIGMEHIKEEYPSLMNLKAKEMSKYDIIQFRFLYRN